MREQFIDILFGALDHWSLYGKTTLQDVKTKEKRTIKIAPKMVFSEPRAEFYLQKTPFGETGSPFEKGHFVYEIKLSEGEWKVVKEKLESRWQSAEVYKDAARIDRLKEFLKGGI